MSKNPPRTPKPYKKSAEMRMALAVERELQGETDPWDLLRTSIDDIYEDVYSNPPKGLVSRNLAILKRLRAK